jgi:uncharacterized protein (TIGR02646 family)
MIHVDRSVVSMPAVLDSKEAEGERARAAEFFAPGGRKTVQKFQERYEVNWTLLRETRPALEELFRHKCAFCESPDTKANPLDVGHFRPVGEIIDPLAHEPSSQSSSASSSAARSSRTGYWWLTYEWENLYLICRACAERSRVVFPVVGRRASVDVRGPDLQHEKPLLIDPCVDRPDEFLTFMTTGLPGVVSARDQSQANAFRAQVTIETYELNRQELVGQRAAAMKALRHVWSATKRGPFRGYDEVRSAIAADRPFLGCVTELIQLLGRGAETAGSAIPSQASAAPRPRRGARRPVIHGWYLQRVEILNFKAISTLALDIPRGESGDKGWQTGWKMLLGENGAGKSTVLQAIVLAFMGPSFFRRQKLVPRSLLRREGNGRVARMGSVKLYWVDRKQPTIMSLTPKRCTFEGETPPPELVLRAYGATRHLPRGRHTATPEARPWDVENLFDPFQPVCDADGWLRGLKGTRAFGSAALSLKDLLGLTPRTRLSRLRGKVRVRVGGVDVTLDELSAGYQSVVVLATDILAAVHGQAHDLRLASGIVLIDELDAHLHPRWKMQIVSSLRRTLPGIQFIATTHEPLCLRGLKSGEIAVMRREGKRVQVLTDIPSPAGLRVDQLLTSPLFGLHSTIDPAVDRDFQRYYQLLGKPSLTPPEEDERARLSTVLREAGILGTPVVGQTRRSQLIYDAVDQYLAKEPSLSLNDRHRFREDTKRKVADIWRDVRIEAEAP